MKSEDLPKIESTLKILGQIKSSLMSTQRPANKEQVTSLIESIESERVYQNKIWVYNATETGDLHSNLDFITFIKSYLNEAIDIVSRSAEPDASHKAGHILRKIAAMALASVEMNSDDQENELAAFINKFQSSGCFFNINITESLSIIDSVINDALKSNPDMHKLSRIIHEGSNIGFSIRNDFKNTNGVYHPLSSMYKIFYIAISAIMDNDQIYNR
jgi:hypothetical protein